MRWHDDHNISKQWIVGNLRYTTFRRPAYLPALPYVDERVHIHSAPFHCWKTHVLLMSMSINDEIDDEEDVS